MAGSPLDDPDHPDHPDHPYRDPSLYDLEYAGMSEDVAWYQAMAWQAAGEVLELGCGTGRLTIPMARTGARVTGVDLSEPMLDGLRRRLAEEPVQVRGRIRLFCADFCSLSLGTRYALVLWPFNALHHCRDDAALHAALDAIDAHLAPGGQVGLDAYLPDLALYDRDPEERVEQRTLVDPDTGEALTSWEQGWWDPDTHTHHVVYHYQRPSGATRTTHLRFTMWELEQLRTAFAAHDFELVHEARDFRSAPLESRSLKYVAILQKRG